MLKIFGNWWKGIKGVQLCACSHFSGYATNLFTCRLTYLAPFARAQFLVKLGGSPNLFLSCDFFLLLLTICIFFHMLDRISTKLGQNDQLVSGYKSYALFDLKGHVGVTGVKNVIFLQKMLLLLHVLLDFYDTWSEWPVNKWLQNVSTVWPQRSCRDHRGQEG